MAQVLVWLWQLVWSACFFSGVFTPTWLPSMKSPRWSLPPPLRFRCETADFRIVEKRIKIVGKDVAEAAYRLIDSKLTPVK